MREDALPFWRPHRLASPELESQDVEANDGQVAAGLASVSMAAALGLSMMSRPVPREP
jgi:hypothetical protein